MALDLTRFLAILLMALASGVSFSHLLQRRPKATLQGTVFLTVQQVLFRNYGVAVGTIEAAALLLTLLLVFRVRTMPIALSLAAVACACVGAMIAVWAVWINPINKTVNSWTADSMPPNWPEFRDRWHRLHEIRLALALIGLSALTAMN
jgi:hypothetical protein